MLLPEETFPVFRGFSIDLCWELNGTSLMILDALMLGLNFSSAEWESVCKIHSGNNDYLRFLH